MRVLFFILALGQTVPAGVSGDVRLSPGGSILPNTPSELAFQAAARSFQSGHWATAARWLEEFTQHHAESPHRVEAILLRAQALYQMGEFNKAAAEIARGENVAGVLADGFLYWKAECRIQLKQFDAATAHLQELLRQYPDSKHALPASVAFATVSARRSDWANVVQLLRPTEGVFQKSAKARPYSTWAQEGRLLLAQALFELQDWETAAEELGKLPATMEPDPECRRLFMLAKLEFQSGNPKDALLATRRLADLARETGQTNQLAQVHCLRAEIHEAASDIPAALRECIRLQAQTMPEVHRQEGFLRAVRLHLQRHQFTETIRVLDELRKLSSTTNYAGALDCLAGEVEWLNHRGGDKEALPRARTRFTRAAKSSVLVIKGRAKWGEGLCFLTEGNLASARDAWSQSIELLGDSPLSPWVRVQLAQAWSRANEYAQARATLQVVLPERLRDIGGFIALRSALALGDFASVNPLLTQLRQHNTSLADQGLLAMAQARLDTGQANEAQLVLVRLRQESPDSPLQPAADLEVIRGLVTKAEWVSANTAYKLWLAKNNAHPLHAQIMFDHAWVQSMSGQSTNVLAAFQAVINTYPNTEQAHLANMWMADDAFNSGTNHLGAEKIYKSISSQTNAPMALRRRATLMAGRSAMARQGFGEARKEFTRLINDNNAPARIKSDAHFALGDLTMLEISVTLPDAIEKLTDATNSFYNVVQANPTNHVAARAWGRIGDCCLLASAKEPGYREHARLAYEKSIGVTGPLSVRVKSQSRLGLAKVLEHQARSGANREKKLAEAVDHLLAVVYGRHLQPGEVQDAYWRGRCGLMAMDLLSQQGRSKEALELCYLMLKDFPAMKTGLEDRKQKFLDQLALEK